MIFNMRISKNNQIHRNTFELKINQVVIIVRLLEEEYMHLMELKEKENITTNCLCRINLELDRIEETLTDLKESIKYDEIIKKCNNKETKNDDVGEDAFIMLHQGYDGQKNKPKVKEAVKIDIKEENKQLSFI